MKPNLKIASALVPDGGEISLHEHDGEFSIRVDGYELMHSRQHESELELARLGCAHLVDVRAPRVLIGGLGMGYTLRETLNMLGNGAEVVLSELLGAVVEWNRKFLGELNEHPLDDARVKLRREDVVGLIHQSQGMFDAILLDVDNGPSAMTDSRNKRLYGPDGITACRRALRRRGCLAVWSAEPNKKFERRLMRCGFEVRRYRAATYKGSKSQSRFVWVASEDPTILPPGGGEPLSLPDARSRAGAAGRRFGRGRKETRAV